jgi:nucleotidyltransferase/DNA polymerase involved in DNA repair
MPFPPQELQVLLAVKGLGPTVLSRLEAMGFHSLQQLADGDAADILDQGASLTGSSCWKNSPQAKSAVQGAIQAAVNHISQRRS